MTGLAAPDVRFGARRPRAITSAPAERSRLGQAGGRLHTLPPEPLDLDGNGDGDGRRRAWGVTR